MIKENIPRGIIFGSIFLLYTTTPGRRLFCHSNSRSPITVLFPDVGKPNHSNIHSETKYLETECEREKYGAGPKDPKRHTRNEKEHSREYRSS